MFGNSPHVPSDKDLYVPIYGIDAFTPNHVLSQFTRTKRRNLILGISVSFAFLYLVALDPKLELSSILFIRFSEPLSDLRPIFGMMAIFILYFELSFLVDFYSDLKRSMVKIHGLRFYNVENSPNWVRSIDQFDFCERNRDVVRLVGLSPDGTIGERRIEVETKVTFQVSELFLSKIHERANWAVRLRKLQEGSTPEKATWNQIDDAAMTIEESAYLTWARSEWSKKVMCEYRKEVYLGFLWWYQIFLPLITGMAALVCIINVSA